MTRSIVGRERKRKHCSVFSARERPRNEIYSTSRLDRHWEGTWDADVAAELVIEMHTHGSRFDEFWFIVIQTFPSIWNFYSGIVTRILYLRVQNVNRLFIELWLNVSCDLKNDCAMLSTTLASDNTFYFLNMTNRFVFETSKLLRQSANVIRCKRELDSSFVLKNSHLFDAFLDNDWGNHAWGNQCKNKSEKYTYLRNIALSMMTEAVNTIESTDTNILINFNETFQQRLTLFHFLYKNI